METTILTQRVDAFKSAYYAALEKAASESDLEDIRQTFLSRQGDLALIMGMVKDLSLEEKRLWGPLLNNIKQDATLCFEEKKSALLHARIQAKLEKEKGFDVTAYIPRPKGGLHPLTHAVFLLEDILSSMGFTIADGPEVETAFINFEALNIPAHHPARDMQDTFWISAPDILMRTHTSSVQIRALMSSQPPLAVASCGRVYRSESTDATHDFMFMQCEGLFIDTHASIGNLIATIKALMQGFYERSDLDVRVRPSYFPFVEPGIEFDISCLFCTSGCSICKKTRWIELGGAGLVHPAVMRACSIDPLRYRGFAWGFGIERLAMLKYGISDIRLFRSNKLPFLEQFR